MVSRPPETLCCVALALEGLAGWECGIAPEDGGTMLPKAPRLGNGPMPLIDISTNPVIPSAAAVAAAAGRLLLGTRCGSWCCVSPMWWGVMSGSCALAGAVPVAVPLWLAFGLGFGCIAVNGDESPLNDGWWWWFIGSTIHDIESCGYSCGCEADDDAGEVRRARVFCKSAVRSALVAIVTYLCELRACSPPRAGRRPPVRVRRRRSAPPSRPSPHSGTGPPGHRALDRAAS